MTTNHAGKEKPRSVWDTDRGRSQRTTTRSISHSVKYRRDLLPSSYFTAGRDCSDLTPALMVPAAVSRELTTAELTVYASAAIAVAALLLYVAGVLRW